MPLVPSSFPSWFRWTAAPWVWSPATSGLRPRSGRFVWSAAAPWVWSPTTSGLRPRSGRFVWSAAASRFRPAATSPRRPARAQVVQTGPAPARAASVPLRRRKSGRLRHPSSRLHLSPKTPSSRKMSPPRHLPATTRTTMRLSGIWSE